MNKTSSYIVGELKTIEKECREKGISATEWVEKYAGDYRNKFWKNEGNIQTHDTVKKNYRKQSRWANWLDRVNDT